MDFITLGGEPAGDIEIGSGPARLCDSETVKKIHTALSGINRETLSKNHQPSEMNKLDIHPNIWERDADEGFEYIAHYLENLKTFVSHCVKHKLGVVVYLC